jgi:hypothetical protein
MGQAADPTPVHEAAFWLSHNGGLQLLAIVAFGKG